MAKKDTKRKIMNTKILDNGPPRRRATRPPGKEVGIGAEKQQQLIADSSKSLSCSQSDPRAFESRQHWALCWPNRRKSQSWQADFSGVVSVNARKFWINIWRNPAGLSSCASFRIQLKPKNPPASGTWRCRLQENSSHQWIGALQLDEQTFSVKLREDVSLNGPFFRIHFEPEGTEL